MATKNKSDATSAPDIGRVSSTGTGRQSSRPRLSASGTAVPVATNLGTVAMTRQTRVYPVLESELDAVEITSTVINGAFGIASVCLGSAGTLFLERQVSPVATPAGELMMHLGPPLLFTVAIVAVCVGWFARKKQIASISRIKHESVEANFGAGER